MAKGKDYKKAKREDRMTKVSNKSKRSHKSHRAKIDGVAVGIQSGISALMGLVQGIHARDKPVDVLKKTLVGAAMGAGGELIRQMGGQERYVTSGHESRVYEIDSEDEEEDYRHSGTVTYGRR